MPRYKVRFSKRWITGRWAFTDRVLDGLGGRPTEGSRLQNAWIVEFKGGPRELGQYLTDALKLDISRDARPGAVFEIEPLDPQPPAEPRRRPRPGTAAGRRKLT